MRVAVTELKSALQRLGQLIPEPWNIPEIDRDGNLYRVIDKKEIDFGSLGFFSENRCS